MQVREIRHARGASLASPAPPIQRKSIHILSTSRGPSAVAFLMLLAVVGGAAGCAGGSPVASGADRTLRPEPDQYLHLTPGETTTVSFRLSSGGVPLSGQHVTFAIDNGQAAQGATLSATDAVTNSSGIASVAMRAGLATTFKIQGTAGAASGELYVTVMAGVTGSVNVSPFFQPGSESQTETAKIELRLFDDAACSSYPLLAPPEATGDLSAPLGVEPGASHRFDHISTVNNTAVFGLAFASSGRVVAAGCVDLPASTVVPNGLVQLALPLADAVPDPVGSYAVKTDFGFSPPLADVVPLAAAYRGISDCPLDPAELLLDCTIDAFSPTTTDDPLDCIPAPGPGAEGPIAEQLRAHLGLPILDGAGADTGCRGARDAGGAVSFDAVVLGLFGSPKPQLLIDLPTIASEAAHLFDRITLTSTLDVQPNGTPGGYTATHSLGSATFVSRMPDSDGIAIGIASYPVPVPTAFATATLSEDQLVIGDHGLTLRLGSIARLGFAQVLGLYGVDGGNTGLMTSIAGLAHSDDRVYRGCAAIDHALCGQIGADPGCLVTACGIGMTAFAARLDDLFAAIDGPGLDLHLSGAATLHDTHDDGSAGRIDGAWSFALDTVHEHRVVSAPLSGVR
jgi:hypothetical protein